MIQRIQSVWLLVSGLLSLLTFRLAFWQSVHKDGMIVKFCTPNSPLLIYIAVVLLLVLSFGAIFLFKNRSLQTRLCLLGMVISIGLLILECNTVAEEKVGSLYTDGSWRPGIVIPLLIIVALFLAIRGIRKDQKLVKSLDRLR